MKRKKSVLNVKASQKNKERGLERVTKGAGEDWLLKAYKVVRRVAEDHKFFTSDDVWKVLAKPEEPRALGPVMMSLERDGVIAATDIFKLSAQGTRNRAPIRLWRSCVFVDASTMRKMKASNAYGKKAKCK